MTKIIWIIVAVVIVVGAIFYGPTLLAALGITQLQPQTTVVPEQKAQPAPTAPTTAKSPQASLIAGIKLSMSSGCLQINDTRTSGATLNLSGWKINDSKGQYALGQVQTQTGYKGSEPIKLSPAQDVLLYPYDNSMVSICRGQNDQNSVHTTEMTWYNLYIPSDFMSGPYTLVDSKDIVVAEVK